tara:strand:+ start:1849 stop:2208 length:360 start_codon:yes stop_codon:yes gene_type:complete
MSTSGQKLATARSNKEDPKLPWWVELLFVQIGLPDSWLSPLLKSKTNSKKLLIENKRILLYIFLIVFGMLYIQPYRTYINRQNDCFVFNVNRLKEQMVNSNLNIRDINSKATYYCNGGL